MYSYPQPSLHFVYRKLFSDFQEQAHKIYSEKQHCNTTEHTQVLSPKRQLCLNISSKFSVSIFGQKLSWQWSYSWLLFAALAFLLQISSPTNPPAPQLPRVQRASQWNRMTSPFILTVGELGPADCFLHPLQFWQRLSASEMKEQRESSSKRSESSNENLSPSSHSANMSSITSNRQCGGKRRKTETALLTFNRWMDLRAPAILKISILIRSPYYSTRRNRASAIWGGRSRKSTKGKLVKIPEKTQVL